MPSNKKTLLGILCLAAIVGIVAHNGADVLFLQSAAAQGLGGGVPKDNIFTTTGKLAATLIVSMQTVAFIIFHFLQFLLDPLFILEINKTQGLRNIWMYSRDIMNVIFAFMLIAAGIFTVVTGNKEVVQQKFKKFILAVILVNFSWFFPRVILDVANVLTATIYQLPAGVNGGIVECMLPATDTKPAEKCKVITDVKYFDACNPPPAGYDTTLSIVCFKWEDWDTGTNTAYGMLNGLVINYGRLPLLARVIAPDSTPDAAGTDIDLLPKYLSFLVHIILILALVTMLFLPLLAMLVVFLIRIPIMWVTIAFMPFMFLGFVMGDKMGQFDTMKIFSHYVKAAFLPAAVAVPFAAGFLILSQLASSPCPNFGAVGAGALGPLCAPTGMFVSGVNTLWGMLMLLIGFFIIWTGFWAALKIDDIYTNVTAGIKSFGESVGKVALKLPLSVPIIPTAAGAKSVLGIDDSIRRIQSKLSAGDGPLESLGAGMGIEGGARTDTDKLEEVVKDGSHKTVDALRDIGGALAAGSDTRALKLAIETARGDDTSDLHKALKENGIDPTKITVDDIINKMREGTDEMKLIVETAKGFD